MYRHIFDLLYVIYYFYITLVYYYYFIINILNLTNAQTNESYIQFKYIEYTLIISLHHHHHLMLTFILYL